MKQGWECGVLGDAVKKGSSNISLNKIKDDDGEYPVFSAKGFAKNVSFFQQEQDYLAIIKDGAGIGRVTKYPAKSSVVATMQYLIPKDGFDIGFIKYFLNGIDFEKHRSGSTIPHVYFKDYKSEVFPLIPLPEQQRIVAILDKAFIAINKVKQNAQQNLKNAKELFESYLQGVFENKGDDWEEKTLGEVCVVERGSSPRPIKDFITDDKDGVNWIKIGDTKNVEKYIYTTKQKITKKGAEKSRFVEEEDFILSNSMSFGKPYIMKTKGYIHDGWFKLKLHDFVDTGYFYQLLSSPYINDQFHNLASGSVVKNISGDLVKKVVLPIPPVSEQKHIVQKLDKLSTETKKLELVYQQKIDALDELKKSTLQKAFEGEL